MKIAAVSSGRPTNNNVNHNNNNHAKEDDSGDDVERHEHYSSSVHKDDSDTSSSCSECVRSDSESTDASHQRKRRTKKMIKNKQEKSGSSSSDSGTDSSDDDHLDSSDSDEVSELSTSPIKKMFTNSGQKRGTPPRNNMLDLDGAASSSNNSDMELPDLVTAAIQRVESESDAGSGKGVQVGTTQYTSSLLHDFIMKTQMLGNAMSDLERLSSGTNLDRTRVEAGSKEPSSEEKTATIDSSIANAAATVVTTTVRKRGRPRKNPPAEIATTTKQSVSPDSGIISTPHSPVQNERKSQPSKARAKKLQVNKTSMDNVTTKGKSNSTSSEKNSQLNEKDSNSSRRKRNDAKTDEVVDPMWRKIDVNKKFRRPSMCGYKSDTGSAICSKVLAARSDYLSDYGNANHRSVSGYKSDYSCKSRRSGYRSDFSVKARSCGYRSDCSLRSRRKVRRKRRTKTASTKPSVNEQDLLLLAGLSLGQSEESSRDSLLNIESANTDKTVRKRPMFRRKTFSGILEPSDKRKSSKNISPTTTHEPDVPRQSNLHNAERLPNLEDSDSFPNPPELDENDKSISVIKPGFIRHRRSSAISHCSSRCSTTSRHPFRRRRRKRLKSVPRTTSAPTVNVTKLNMQIDQVINAFTSQCTITNDKSAKETRTGGTKRNVKKRKGAAYSAESSATTCTPTTKRRHKKTVQTQSPDEHKLPLKKRHYLLPPGEKSEAAKAGQSQNGVAISEKEKQKSDETGNKGVSKVSANKAVTPKKRHLLETPVSTPISFSQSSVDSSSASDGARDSQVNSSINENGKIQTQNKKSDTLARKKSRLEGVVSKIQPLATTNSDTANQVEYIMKGSSSRVSVIRNIFTDTSPPPGVFEPSVDLELQIPYSAISIPSMIAKSEVDSPQSSNSNAKTSGSDGKQKSDNTLEKLPKRIGSHAWLKRKRKKPNRTGFPATKKKKKKPVVSTVDTSLPCSNLLGDSVLTSSTTLTAETLENLKKITSPKVRVTDILQSNHCDRVPSEGEATATFIERHSRPRLSVVSLERLQGKEECPKVLEANKRLRDTSTDTVQSRKRARSECPKNGKRATRDLSATNVSLDERKLDEAENDNLSEDDEPLINRINISKGRLNPGKKSRIAVSEKAMKPRRIETSSERAIVKLEISDRANAIAVRQRKNHNKTSGAETILPTIVDISVEQPLIADQAPVLKRKRGRPFKNPRTEEMPVSRSIDASIIDPQTESVTQLAAANDVPSDKRKLNLSIVSDTENTTNKKAKLKYQKTDKTNEEINLANVSSATKTGTEKSNSDNLKSNEAKRSIGDKLKSNEVETEGRNKKGRPSSKLSQETIAKANIEQSRTKTNTSNTSGKESSGKNEKDKQKSNETRAPRSDKDKKEVEKHVNRSNGNINSKQNHAQKAAKHEKLKGNDSSKAVSANNRLDKDGARKENGSKKHKDDTKAVTSTNPRAKSQEKIVLNCELAVPHEAHVADENEYTYNENDIKPLDENEYDEHDPLPSKEDDGQEDTDSCRSSDGKKLATRWRKKYLTAGLFSNHYKETYPLADKALQANSPTTENTPTSLLPAPLYCEKYFRQAQHDFQLPYDLWWANENEKLPGRVQSWNFKKIRTNVYCDVRANPSSDHQPCSCKSEAACGDDCLNRMVYAECSTETCPCGDKCSNTKIQRHIIAPGVDRFMTKNKGWGVRTKLPIKKGTYILEYVGEVVTEREFKDRMATLYNRDIHHYCLHLDGGLVIDGHRMGSDCRFVNHSCAPNCEMQKWSVNGLSRMALFAMRDIQPGEELSYDYNFSLFNPAEGQPCKCEAPECRGVIGGKSQRVRPIEPKPINDKTKSKKKVRSGRPKKGGTSKSRTFMHSKDLSKMNVFQLPNAKEQGLVIDGHCFLLRNLRKVRR